MSRRVVLFALVNTLVLVGGVNSQAAPIRVTDLLSANPTGTVTFATAVESYNPAFPVGDPAGGGDAVNTLGAPDYADHPHFASLGLGGSIVLGFRDGALTGSGTAAPDLVVSEVGPDVEDTFAWVSSNGSDWVSLGRVAGGTTAIDIDALGLGADRAFSFLKLVDDPGQGLRSGLTVGADIDSVAVVSSTPVPEPGALILLATGLAGIVARKTLARR
jgi:hypothetical protein